MRRNQTQRGATTVEAAIAVPIVFLLIFLVFQSALFMRSFISVREAATAGARAGSVAANEGDADYDVVRAVDRALTSSSRGSLKRIVVYKATDTSSGVPSGCESHGVPGKCNFYSAVDLGRSKDDFGPGNWGGDDHWSPTSRNVSSSGDPDLIGVYVEISAKGGGSLFPGTVSRNVVLSLEQRG